MSILQKTQNTLKLDGNKNYYYFSRNIALLALFVEFSWKREEMEELC